MFLAALLIPATLLQAPVTLKYLPPVGKAIKYRMVMDMKQGMGAAGSMNMTTTMDTTMKALARSGDVTTVETTTGNGKVSIPANSPMASMKAAMEKQMAGKSVVTKMNSHYGIVSSDNAMVGSMGVQAGGALSGFSFPNHPVRVGDSWSASLDMGKMMKGGMGGMAMTGTIPIKMKLLSVSGGKATISMEMSGVLTMAMPGGARSAPAAGSIRTTMSGKGTFVSYLSDGTLISTKMATDSTTAVGPNTMKQHMVQTMTRL